MIKVTQHELSIVINILEKYVPECEARLNEGLN